MLFRPSRAWKRRVILEQWAKAHRCAMLPLQGSKALGITGFLSILGLHQCAWCTNASKTLAGNLFEPHASFQWKDAFHSGRSIRSTTVVRNVKARNNIFLYCACFSGGNDPSSHDETLLYLHFVTDPIPVLCAGGNSGASVQLLGGHSSSREIRPCSDRFLGPTGDGFHPRDTTQGSYGQPYPSFANGKDVEQVGAGYLHP